MSRKYKFYNKQGVFFVSFAVVNWIDVFVREAYFNDIVESLKYCMEHKGMEIYSWCIISYLYFDTTHFARMPCLGFTPSKWFSWSIKKKS